MRHTNYTHRLFGKTKFWILNSCFWQTTKTCSHQTVPNSHRKSSVYIGSSETNRRIDCRSVCSLFDLNIFIEFQFSRLFKRVRRVYRERGWSTRRAPRSSRWSGSRRSASTTTESATTTSNGRTIQVRLFTFLRFVPFQIEPFSWLIRAIVSLSLSPLFGRFASPESENTWVSIKRAARLFELNLSQFNRRLPTFPHRNRRTTWTARSWWRISSEDASSIQRWSPIWEPRRDARRTMMPPERRPTPRSTPRASSRWARRRNRAFWTARGPASTKVWPPRESSAQQIHPVNSCFWSSGRCLAWKRRVCLSIQSRWSSFWS